MCIVLQHPLTATGTAVWCAGMCQVPPGVDSSNRCCELSLLLRGWSLGSLPCQTSTRCDTPPAIGCLVNCTDCSRDIKAGEYEGHDCVPSLTPEEEKQAAGLLKRAISTSPDKGIIQLPTGGTVK